MWSENKMMSHTDYPTECLGHSRHVTTTNIQPLKVYLWRYQPINISDHLFKGRIS